MSTPVDTTFVRRNNGNFPIVDDGDVGGGYHVVPDAATRDAILSNLRKAGMLVLVQADGTPPGTLYQLQADLTTWLVFSGGAGGGLPPLTGNALKFLRVNAGETLPEWVTLTADMIAPAFAISSFGGPSSPVELGVNVTDPAFTASYNQTPASATLDDGSGALALVTPFTAFAYDGLGPLPARGYTSSAINHVVTWTLHATNSGGNSTSASHSVQWEPRVYFDIATVPGAYDETFIKSLTNNSLAAAFARTIAFGAGGGTKHLFYAFPTAFGTPTRFLDVNTGFGIPFSKVASAVALTNAFSVVVPGGYDIWMSDNPLIAAVTTQVS
jgi:hypothetical protein